ncbi:hypothetical protein [Polymorphospora sp. NPDC050346]|uniref:hypothetical protein n=1 Tax=Polymorphospora sp. NPDC050346 TaxID=3155780 RepID=UPI0034001057
MTHGSVQEQFDPADTVRWLIQAAADSGQLDLIAGLSDGAMQQLLRDRNRLDAELGRAQAQISDLKTRLAAARRLQARAEQQPTATPVPADLAAELDQLRHDLAQARADRDTALTDRDLYAELLDTAEDERDDAIRDRALLAARLLEYEPEPDSPDEDAEPVPDTFRELLAQAEARYPLLALTLDRQIPAQLDHLPQAPAWRARTVAALKTLHGYATARAAGGDAETAPADLLAWCRNGGPGVHLSAAAVASGERQRVTESDHYGRARVFPVPADVDPSQKAAMWAHIRIGGVRPPAPRMHYLDDTAHTGLIVVGYVGPHLPSPRTN